MRCTEGCRIPKNKNYGAYLADFMWRNKHLNGKVLPERSRMRYALLRIAIALIEVSVRHRIQEEVRDNYDEPEATAEMMRYLDPKIKDPRIGEEYP